MPEMPEVESLVQFLRPRCVGEVIARVDLAAFREAGRGHQRQQL
jgi:formamidopyrimidine-DNA glycosylase